MSYQEKLEKFKSGNSELTFKCIKDRSEFAEILEGRANNPFLINQGFTPLCGPAAFMHCIASDRREEYVHYVLDLAEKGIGKLGGLVVKPSAVCRNAELTTKQGTAINPVDWVALASLRDSSNSIFPMSGPSSNAAGITLGRVMAEWFSKTGWFPGGAINATRYSGSLPHYDLFENLLSTNQRVNGHVCLLIRSAIAVPGAGIGYDKLNGSKTPKTWHGTADHWVVRKSVITLDGKTPPVPGMLPRLDLAKLKNQTLHFRFWHWGKKQAIPINNRVQDITPAKFLPYYYGYVSATR